MYHTIKHYILIFILNLINVMNYLFNLLKFIINKLNIL